MFEIFYTSKYEAQFCDEPDMTFLGKLKLTFGHMEITATARNELNGVKVIKLLLW